MHVHYVVHTDLNAKFKRTDANRTGNEKKGAFGYVDANWKDFDLLAAVFLAHAFATPPVGPLGHLAGQDPGLIARASQQAVFDSISNEEL